MFGKMSKKAMAFGLVATMSAGLLVGCSSNSGTDTAKQGDSGSQAAAKDDLSGKITASGSTALLPLVKQAADEFQKQHANVTVDVTGGGSGTGLKQVADGSVNIGNSDVEAGADYKDKNLVDHQVVVAPFALVTNNDVTIDNLTKEQAGKIFDGEITNWKDVGGKDEKITIIGRPESSGSRKLVKQLVLPADKDFAKDAIAQDSSGSLRTAVAQTPGAIGYVDVPYLNDQLHALKFDGVAYSQDTLFSGQYKLFAFEHMYTKGEPDKLTQAFLDFIMSNDFQTKFVEQLKFVPVSKMKK